MRRQNAITCRMTAAALLVAAVLGSAAHAQIAVRGKVVHTMAGDAMV